MAKIKEHFRLKTMMYNIIMFQKIIFEILTRNTTYTCSIRIRLIRRWLREKALKANTIQFISTAAITQIRTFFIKIIIIIIIIMTRTTRTTRTTGSVPFAHVAIDHSHSQQPVPRGFPLFKWSRCEWLVINCNVNKRDIYIIYINII